MSGEDSKLFVNTIGDMLGKTVIGVRLSEPHTSESPTQLSCSQLCANNYRKLENWPVLPYLSKSSEEIARQQIKGMKDHDNKEKMSEDALSLHCKQ